MRSDRPIPAPAPPDPSDHQSAAKKKQIGCVLAMLFLFGLAILCFLFLLRMVFG